MASKRETTELLLRAAGMEPGGTWVAGVLESWVLREDGSGRFSSYTFHHFSLSAVHCQYGLWISASWVGARKSLGYSHLGTREVEI